MAKAGTRIEIHVPRGGPARCIHSDTAEAFLQQTLGPTTIRRASHVEPWGNLSTAAREWYGKNVCRVAQTPAHIAGWFADMQPVNGPVLGPFTTKQQALDEEVAWLHANNIPVPKAPSA